MGARHGALKQGYDYKTGQVIMPTGAALLPCFSVLSSIVRCSRKFLRIQISGSGIGNTGKPCRHPRHHVC